MTNQYGIDNIRFAKSETLLAKGYLKSSYQLPEPALASYTLGSQILDLTQGGNAYRGDRKFILLWQNIFTDDAHIIWNIINDAIGDTGEMWATADKGWNGSGFTNSWIDIKGIPKLPQIVPQENSNGLIVAQLIFQIDNTSVQNDPASF